MNTVSVAEELQCPGTRPARAAAREPVLSGIAYLGTARIAVTVLNLIATSRLAHALGIEGFGVLSFGSAYVAYFLIVLNFGFEPLTAREVALDPGRQKRLVQSIVLLRLVLGAGLAVVLLATLPLLNIAPLARLVVAIQGASLFSAAVGVSCVYQGLGRMRVLASRECMGSLLNTLGIVCFVHGPGDVVPAAIAMAAALALSNGLLFWRYRQEFGSPGLRLPNWRDFRVARESAVYFWSLLMIAVTYNTHIVLLGLLRGEAEVGLFSASWKIFILSIAVPNLLAALFLPRLVRPADPEEPPALALDLFLQTIVVCAVPICLIGGALVPQMLAVLFGASYLVAAPTLMLLLLNGLVVSLNIAFGTALTAAGRQSGLLRIVGVGAAAGLVLNLLLIPPMGGEGAAIATLVAEAFILVLFLRQPMAFSRPQALTFGARCLAAAVPAAFAARWGATLGAALWTGGGMAGGSNLVGLIVGGALGSGVYFVCLHLARVPLIQLTGRLRQA